jgi:hypothetical protein
MIKSEEEKIGIKITLTALAIWLLTITLFLTISTGVVSFDDFTSEGILTLLIVVLSTIFWGAKAGKQIIRDKKHDDFIGIKTAFIILLTFFILTYLFTVDFSIFTRDTYTLTNAAKGFLFYFFIYSIPTIITGIIIGRTIKKRGIEI